MNRNKNVSLPDLLVQFSIPNFIGNVQGFYTFRENLNNHALKLLHCHRIKSSQNAPIFLFDDSGTNLELKVRM